MSFALNTAHNMNRRVRLSLYLVCRRFTSGAEPRTNDSAKPKIERVAPHLIDTFGRQHTYLRISLTERCNLRCTYCMPEKGVQLSKRDELLTTDEMLSLAHLFVKQGVTKIRLTGGEPTVNKDLSRIIGCLKNMDGLRTVAMTTNGLTLTRQLVDLQKAGLNQVNISLDTLKADKYEKISRRKGWPRVIAGIDLAVQLGFHPVKVNVVAMKGVNDDEILDFVEFTKTRPVDIRFIEYMPFTGNKWETEKMVPFKEMMSMIKEKHPDFSALENDANDTSKAYHVPGYEGRVGFITSMSEHFCGSCNRLRLMADGSLKVCLFGNAEVSLRDALRANTSEEDLLATIGAAVFRKKKQHAGPLLRSSFHFAPNSITRTSGIFIRCLSSLTHVDSSGKAAMVDVGHKTASTRTATARCEILLGPHAFKLLKDNGLKKGDALTVAQLAGVIGAKKTHELIPLCHNVVLDQVKCDLTLNEENHSVVIHCTAKCSGKTGVEMEAMVGASIAGLTVYDMCKAVTHRIVIKEVFLVEKTGGARGDYHY